MEALQGPGCLPIVSSCKLTDGHAMFVGLSEVVQTIKLTRPPG